MDELWTNMAVKTATKKRLMDLKIHPNQSFDEVINDLIASQEKASAETISETIQ